MDRVRLENQLLYNQIVQDVEKQKQEERNRKSGEKDLGFVVCPNFTPNKYISTGKPLLPPLKYKRALLSFTPDNRLLKSTVAQNDDVQNFSSLGRVITDPNDLPKEFDWRKIKDNNGNPVLSGIQDQKDCGACYAFSTAQCLSHRFAISSGGAIRPVLSAQDMINCGKAFIKSTFENPQYNDTLKELQQNGTLDAQAKWYILAGLLLVYILKVIGCEGGLLVSALDYTIIFGLPEQSSVPYTGSESGFDYCLSRNNLKKFYGRKTHALTAGIEDSLPENDVKIPLETLTENIQNMQMSIISDGPIISAVNIFTDLLYYPHTGMIYDRKNTILVNGKQKKVKYQGGNLIILFNTC